MARLTVTISSLATFVWRMRWKLKGQPAGFGSRTTQSILTSTRRGSKLKLTMARKAKERRGVVCTVSAVGFAIVVVTPAASRDGTNTGAHLCDRHWTFCATKTWGTLKQRAENCFLIHGKHATTVLRSFSILINCASNSFAITPADC